MALTNNQGDDWIEVDGYGRISKAEYNDLLNKGRIRLLNRDDGGNIVSQTFNVPATGKTIETPYSNEEWAKAQWRNDPLKILAKTMINSIGGSAMRVKNAADEINRLGYNPYNPSPLAQQTKNAVSGAVANAIYDVANYARGVQSGDLKPVNYFTSNDLAKAKEDREKQEWLQKNQFDMSYGQSLDKAVHDTMNNSQNTIYNKLYDTYGAEEAEKYYKSIQKQLNQKFINNTEEQFRKAAKENPLGYSVVSFFSNPAKAMEWGYRMAQKATTGKIDENDPMGVANTTATNAIRDVAGDEFAKAGYEELIRRQMLNEGYSEPEINAVIDDKVKEQMNAKIPIIGNGGKFLYNTLMSMGDSAINMMFQKGIVDGVQGFSKATQKLAEFVGLTPMGMIAAQDVTIAAKQRGLSEDQAIQEGLIAGVLEQATEIFSVEAFLNPDKSLMKGNKLGYYFKNAFAEGGEEFASSVGNMIADKIIAGDKSEVKRRMKELRRENEDWDDTRAWATAVAEQIVPDFAGGFISGFGMGAIGGQMNSMNSTRMLDEYANAPEMAVNYRDMETLSPVIEMALENESDSTSHQIAESIKEQIESGAIPSDEEISGLLSAIDFEDLEANRPKLKDDIQRLKDKIFAKRDQKRFNEWLEEQNKVTPEQEQFMNENPMSSPLSTDSRPYNPLTNIPNESLVRDENGKLSYKMDSNKANTIWDYGQRQEITNTEKLSADELRAKYGGSPATDTVALLTADMPKQEQYIINNFYDGKSDPYTYVADMRDARRAGIAGEDINSIQSSLNEAQKKAAYELGRSDLNELHLRESGKWSNGTDTRGQVRTMEQSTGKERNIKGDADKELSLLDLGENDEIQVEIKDEHGRTHIMSYVPVNEGIETAKIRGAQKKADDIGYQLILTNGLQRYGNRYARGTIDTTNKIMYVQVNHPVFNSEQIAGHEEMHERIANGEVDIADVLLRITTRFGEDKVREMLDDYRDAYDGSGMSDEYVIEEIICDANGGINIFAEANDILAKKFAPQIEAVKAETEKSKNGQPNAPPKTDKRALRLSEEIRKNIGDKEHKYIIDELYNRRYGKEHTTFDTKDGKIGIRNNSSIFIVDEMDDTDDPYRPIRIYDVDFAELDGDKTQTEKALGGIEDNEKYGNVPANYVVRICLYSFSLDRTRDSIRFYDFENHRRNSRVHFGKNGNVLSATIKGTRNSQNGRNNFEKRNSYSRLSEEPRNVGYHAGDLGKAEARSKQGGGRDTGHFGTGTYFVGDKAKLTDSYSKRPIEEVDFSKYNLYRPLYEKEGLNVHDFLKGVDKYAYSPEYKIRSESQWEKLHDDVDYALYYDEDYDKKDIYEKLKELYGDYRVQEEVGRLLNLGTSTNLEDVWYDFDKDKDVSLGEALNKLDLNELFDRFDRNDRRRAIDAYEDYADWEHLGFIDARFAFGKSEEELKKIFKEVQKEVQNFKGDETTADSAATLFMKKLGYEGVDVRGMKGLDNTTYGSVIYDLKDEDLARKKEIGTARFSEESESLAEMRKANKELEKELLNATKEIEKWKKKYNITSPLKANYHDAELIADDFIKRYGSTKSKQEIARKIAELGDYILNASRDKNMSPEDFVSQLRTKAIDIAGDLVLTSNELSDETDYNIIRQMLENGVRISPSDRQDIKDAPRNVRIANNGKELNDVYEALSDKFGWYFPSDITNPAEQLMQIDDVIDDIRPYYDNSYSQYGFALSEITNAIANELIADSSFGQIQPQNMGQRVNELTKELQKTQRQVERSEEKIENIKAKNEEEIANLKAENKEKLDKLRAQKNEKIEQVKNQYREATKEKIEKFKAKKKEEIADLKENFKNREKRGKDRRKAKELRAKIEKHVKALSKKLLSPTKTNHITERQDPKLDSLKATTATILSLINMESAYNVTEDGKHHAKEGGFPTKTLAWQKLKAQYEEIIADSTYLTDEALVGKDGWLSQISDFASTPISKLNAEQLEMIYKTLLSLESTLTMSDKAFAAMKGKTISEIVHLLYDDNMKKKAHKIYGRGKKHGSDSLDFLNDVSVELLDAHSFFHRLGENGDKLFRALRDSQDNSIRFYQQVKLWIDENLDVDLDKAVTETVPVTLGGKTVNLTLGQLMELYVTSKREQGRNHLLNGGFELLDAVEKKGLIWLESDNDTHKNITQEELDNAALLLGAKFPEYRKAADAMQEFMSTTGAEYGNAASERTYGYKKFDDENYWKLRVSKDALNSNIDNYQSNVTTVGNKGMSKPVNPNATQQVYIGNAFDTFLDMIVEMCDYGSYLEVTEDMNRIFNYNNPKEEINTKKIIRHALGTKGEKYWLDLMRDVSNASVAMNSIYGGATNKALGMFKAGAVGGNLRVIVQQPTAILRAMDMIDGKYLAMGVKNPFKGMEKAKKYAPIAQWKDWGYFDMNNGRTLHDLIYDDPSKVKKVSEFLMKGAGQADNFAWGILWNAVEAETKAKTNLKVGSEEYYQHCGERFAEIIDSSQVVDGVLQRAGVMRKTDMYSKMATAFMAEPLKQLNQFMNAVYDARNGRGSRALVLKTARAMASAALLNAVVKSLIDAMRHSEREKKYWEKFADEFWGLNGDEKDLGEKFMNGFLNGYLGGKGNAYEMFDLPQYLPYLRDIASLFRGYDVERSDLSVLGSVKKAGENLAKAMSGEGKDTIFSSASTFLGEVSKFTGIPAGNVMRDLYSGINAGLNEFGADYAVYEWNKLFYNIDAVDKSGNKKNKTLYMDLLYNAWANDHTEDFNLMYEDMKKHFSAKEFQNYWNKKMAEEQGLDGSTKDIEGKVNFKKGDIGKHTTISEEKKAENVKATAEKKEEKAKKEEHEEDIDDLYEMWVNNDPSFESMYNSLKDEIKPEEFQTVWDTNMKEEQGVDNVKNLEGRVNFARGDIGKHTTISAAKKAENEKATAEAKAKKEAKEEASANLYSTPTYKQVSSSNIWKQATSDMQKKTEDTIINLQTGNDASTQEHIDIAKTYGISESNWLLYHLAWQVVDASGYSEQFGKGGNNGSPDNYERQKAAEMVGIPFSKIDAVNKAYNKAHKK